MDIDYKEVINFSKLKDVIVSKRTTSKYVAEDCGFSPIRISQIINGTTTPVTSVIAKICYALKVHPSEICEFKDIKVDERKKQWFDSHALPYEPAEGAVGDVTYEPLRAMVSMYLDYLYENTGKEKTADDIFDMIVPYRVRNNIADGTKKALEARGLEIKTKRASKGLTADTRSKIRLDRSLNIRTIYDICNFFGCSIDWVMSYK